MPTSGEFALLVALVAVVAALYASVGHAGASGYLACMALLGVEPALMKPTALALNIVVAVVATVAFTRAGLFRAQLFWPLAAVSVPLAFLGGATQVDDRTYRLLVGTVLLYAAWRLVLAAPGAPASPARRAPLAVLLVAGAGIGLLSGLVGVGGGIFLSPLILLLGWAGPRETAGVSAPFILVNSIAGLAGRGVGDLAGVQGPLLALGAAVLLGGWFGARLGSRQLQNITIRRLLALVVALAGVKLLLT